MDAFSVPSIIWQKARLLVPVSYLQQAQPPTVNPGTYPANRVSSRSSALVARSSAPVMPEMSRGPHLRRSVCPTCRLVDSGYSAASGSLTPFGLHAIYSTTRSYLPAWLTTGLMPHQRNLTTACRTVTRTTLCGCGGDPDNQGVEVHIRQAPVVGRAPKGVHLAVGIREPVATTARVSGLGDRPVRQGHRHRRGYRPRGASHRRRPSRAWSLWPPRPAFTGHCIVTHRCSY